MADGEVLVQVLPAAAPERRSGGASLVSPRR
jgi:hypothetical protein